MGELKYTFDIMDEKADISKYKVIILPDVIPVTPLLQEKLERHLSMRALDVGSQEKVTFKMGFRPLGSEQTLWSNEITVRVEPDLFGAWQNPDRSTVP